MKLYIKYMVSLRCKMVVKYELEKLGLPYKAVELGSAELARNISPQEFEQLRAALAVCELELVDNKTTILVERIKTVIIEMVHSNEEPTNVVFSYYLSQKINHDYTYMANVFSEVTGITIKDYIIAIKIERAKEMIIHDELSLTEISYALNYCSVAHLSYQFKNVTGLTPSFFKQIQQKRA